VEFCESHLPPFTANAVAIGTTALAVTDLETKTVAARAAYQAQVEAKQAAEAATNDFNMAAAAMTRACADILKQIKTKAALSGDSVYSLANVPVPATPAPKGPPGKPVAFVATLDDSGALSFKFKCPNPPGASGTIYQVWRRIAPPGGSGEFEYLGGSGTREYVDATIPAGSSQVTYQIQAVRSTAVGPWAQFNVNFGVSGGSGSGGEGVTALSVTEQTPSGTPKMAA
jgi:hypothetical protein